MSNTERIDGPISLDLEAIRQDIFYITGNSTYLGTEITVNQKNSPCVFFREKPNGTIRYIYANGYLIYGPHITNEVDFDTLKDLINQNLHAEAILVEIDRQGIYKVLQTY